MKRIDALFDVKYGVNLELNALSQCKKGNPNAVNFVSRAAGNNGVSAIVERLANVEPIPAGTLTVAAGGSVLETFLQAEPYYSGRDLYYLTAKVPMTDPQKLYYCTCIRANKYRYNYGRQANKTLRGILVPDICEIPQWVNEAVVPSYGNINASIQDEILELDPLKWELFCYNTLFDIKKGKRVTKLDMIPGYTPFLSAIDNNNGIREYSGLVAMHEGNTITVNYNGSVGEAFYQEQPFWASDDINVLYPKFALNKYIAIFLITIIRQDKYRFNYGRKWHKERMEISTMKLPVKPDGAPDWGYMERYIKSLPYSASI